MLVTDAGVWIHAFVQEGSDGAIRGRLREEGYVDAPALIDIEFLSGIRGLVAGGRVTRRAAEQAIDLFLGAPIDRHPHGPLAWRIWQLRSNLTPYDAAYVALAEMLGNSLLTFDARLARAPTIRCSVELAKV